MQLIDSMTEVCRNFLQFDSELTIEGLLGVTLDNSEVILVNVNETLKRPTDIVSSVCANLPSISKPDALSTYLADYSACDTGSVAKLPKRKKHGLPPQDNIRVNTQHMGSSRPHIAKPKRHRSESCLVSSGAAHMDDGLTSNNCPEGDIFLRSSESGTARKTAKEFPHASGDHSEPQFSVKMENGESVALVNSDDGTEQSQQDDSLNIDGALSASCWQSDNDDATADKDTDGGSDGDPCKTSNHQNSDNPSRCSITDDCSQFVIGDVFIVKQEPVFDDEYMQQSPTLQRSCVSERVPRDKTQVSLLRDHITAVNHLNLLQVDCTLLCYGTMYVVVYKFTAN